MTEQIEKMIIFAKSKIGLPYRWGGNGPHNYDCSGFALAVLKEFNFIDANIDITAQDIFYYLSNKSWVEKKEVGSFCFFGRLKIRITHVGIILNEFEYIGANGGDHRCISDEIASMRNAKVDIRNIRRDLIATLYPRI